MARPSKTKTKALFSVLLQALRTSSGSLNTSSRISNITILSSWKRRERRKFYTKSKYVRSDKLGRMGEKDGNRSFRGKHRVSSHLEPSLIVFNCHFCLLVWVMCNWQVRGCVAKASAIVLIKLCIYTIVVGLMDPFEQTKLRIINDVI